MFIFKLTYKKALSEVEAHLAAHREFLDEYYKSGRLVASGPCEPRTGGVILCDCPSLEEAERIRDQDPFYREGAARYEIIQFLPTKMSGGFQALLGEGHGT